MYLIYNIPLFAELEQANNELEQQNVNLRNTISSQKSSISNATTYSSTKFGGEAGFGAVAGIVGFIALAVGGGGFGTFCIIVVIVTFTIKGGITTRNVEIRDTLQYIRENEAKINQNTNQINQNDGVIARQKAGLAPRPITISASPK